MGATVVLCAGGISVIARRGNPATPDIVLVMSDDHGWGDTGYNGHPFVRTPALDAMAQEGFVFDRFYAGSPVCSPTRASLLTGRTPIRGNVPHHGHWLRASEETIAETLKRAGYVTGIFGKFHLGSGLPESPCNPTSMGFDEWVIGLNYFDNDPYLSRNGVVEQRRGKGSVIVMDEAIDFIEKHKDGDRPTFTVIWFPSPHDPHEEVPDGAALYDGEDHAGYYREITLLDQQIGRLRAALRTWGIADNTILWYCSDNGGLVPETSGGREMKGSVYEGGLRVPGVLEWPARRLTGRTSVPVSTCDMYPTLLAMAAETSAPPSPLDGIDVSEIVAGSVEKRSRPIGFWHAFQLGKQTFSDETLAAVRDAQMAGETVSDDPDRDCEDVDVAPRFAEDSATGHAAWTDWPWKLHRIQGTTFELYDLEDDPMETTDLSADPRHEARFERMRDELDAWMRSVIGSLNGDDGG